ncbi:methanogenesis marker 2 protein [Archaeoglobales archaeon]|nr:MAG: methanogenesis marker 2 protein [Archaeoglobales archaeon]
MLKKIVESIRNYEGLRRKKYAGVFGKKIGVEIGEDAAVIDVGTEDLLLFTADGIWDVVLQKDLQWGGFVSILVNIHDIAAMGGIAISAVNIVSVVDDKALDEISMGMRRACDLYGVGVVNGHIHPNANTNSIDVAMIGKVKRNSVVYSNTAKAEDYLVYAVDLDGNIHPKLKYNFDSTKKDARILRMQMEAMQKIGEEKIASAGKDVSNAGLVGTIGMMMEVSRKGCTIDLNSVPKPDGIEMGHWLKVYPAAGFVITTPTPEKAIKIFEKHFLTASIIGRVNNSLKVELCLNGERKTVFDFDGESILGLF